MKIRTRLALQFTIIVASLLLIFASAIYYFSSSYRQKEFYERLYEKAGNYAKLIVEVDEVSPHLMKIFDRNTAYLHNERILVYDGKDRQIFNTNDDSVNLSRSFLGKIRSAKELKYKEGNNEVLALLYPNKNDLYVVIVSAYDKDGLNKLDYLKIILFAGLLVCVIATMLAGWIYSGQALSPISGVVEQVEKTTISNLTERVNEGNGKDEIGQLAITFNRMLERIQKSFELQKSFVSNSSHELRTPLTAITGQLEVALMSQREPDEYKTVLTSILEDIKSVNRLTNGLLELAQADMDLSKLSMRKVRIDELLWQTRNELLKRNTDYKIHIEIAEFPEDEGELIIMGSEHLLRSALINIMDNACKFSDDRAVKVVFRSHNEVVHISFRDHGIGISEEDIKKISQPFYRGINAKMFPGHGLGLSLTSKIIALHKGKITIVSKLKEFTEVNVSFRLFDQD
jgi:signal transduction histidine kinase